MEIKVYPFYARLSLSLVAIFLIFFFLKYAESIFIPMSFAGLLAIMLIAPCDFLEKKGIPRGIAAIVSLLLSVFLVVFVLYFISSQIISFRNDLPALVTQFESVLDSIQVWIKHRFHMTHTGMQQLMNSAKSQTISSTGSIVGSTVSSLSNTLLYAVLIPIYTFLLLLYRGLVVRFLIRAFQDQHTPKVYDILGKTRHVIKNYIVGLMIEMAIVAFLNCTLFFIIGVKYALLLGVIGALLNLIPYLGIFTALILSCLITFTTNTPTVVLELAIAMVGVHLVDSNILLPRVVGSKVRINALATILGVVVGSMLWGIPGMFLAVPIVAILKVIFDGVDSLNAWGILLGDDRDEATVHQKKKHGLRWPVLRKRRVPAGEAEA
ncbi:AI-2E family transporter [Dinghuibacter silviterrae]|uniref:Putative PurR-regulated permease PerM n=1 Tax=Dinghuibacter silviterrae TaxID=1539049 RepID=A0A4R8DIL9_9BACT|nr:AI-2E family transporter [Dinghuibacter silviterrae]TDW97591.1 putative PurR-regulated permease PerM [Dinghuibacter silviterrae]